MTQHTNRLSQFWQELKRRNVHRSVAIYAGSAFVFLEAATIIFPRWGFPDWSIDLVLYLLVLGAIITIAVAWIFDITPEGVQKTKPADEVPDSEKSRDSNTWKLATYISLVVIVAFIIFNVVSHSKEVRAGSIESLMILPFDNFTGLDDFEYYVDGMHAGLCGDLGKISALRVISKTTSKRFKDADMSISEIAAELGLDVVIEPSISCYGEDSLCLQIIMTKTFPEEQQIWAQDYRVAKTQILKFYNDVTKNISKEINVVLTPQEESRLSDARMVDPDAYEAYLKGQYYWEMLHPDSIKLALEFFELAVHKEPEWADPYVGLANTWMLFGNYGTLPNSVTTPNIVRNLGKAMELDPQSAQAHYGNAIYAVWTNWDWELGEKEFKKTIEINPNDALARLYYAHLLMILHRYDEAVQQADIGLALDPLRPLVLTFYSLTMTATGNYQTAIDVFETNRDLGSLLASMEGALEALYLTGDYEGWIQNWEIKVRTHWNDTAIENVVNTFNKKGHIAAIEEMFKMNKKYGNVVPGGALFGNDLKARRSLYLNKPEDALDYLEESFNSLEFPLGVAYIGSDTYVYEKLKTYPRYIELLRKMNLPLPKD